MVLHMEFKKLEHKQRMYNQVKEKGVKMVSCQDILNSK